MEMEAADGTELRFMNFSVSLTNLSQPSSGATCDYQGEMFLLIKPVSSVRIQFRLIRLQNFTFENVRPNEFNFILQITKFMLQGISSKRIPFISSDITISSTNFYSHQFPYKIPLLDHIFRKFLSGLQLHKPFP